MRPLPWNQFLLLTLVSLDFGFIAPHELENPVEDKRRPRGQVDCQKYVYAPACRGISAKRSILTALSSLDGTGPNTAVLTPQMTELEDAILKSFLLSRTQNLIKNLLLEKFLQDGSHYTDVNQRQGQQRSGDVYQRQGQQRLSDVYQRQGQARLKQDSGEVGLLPFLLGSDETTTL